MDIYELLFGPKKKRKKPKAAKNLTGIALELFNLSNLYASAFWAKRKKSRARRRRSRKKR